MLFKEVASTVCDTGMGIPETSAEDESSNLNTKTRNRGNHGVN